MVKEKGQEIIETTEETFNRIVKEEPPQQEPQPPAAEEQMATLQNELKELKTKYEQADKGLRSAQATLTQKDRLLKERENYARRLDSVEDSIQILAGLVSKGGNFDPDMVDGYKKEFASLKEQRKREEEAVALKEKQDEYMQKATSIYAEAEGIFSDDVDTLHLIRNYIRAGDFDLAEKKIVKAKGDKPVDNKPSDEVTKRLEALEKENQRLKDIVSGRLDSETGLPAGASGDEKTIRKNYREKPDDPDARAAYYSLDSVRNKIRR